VNLHLIQYIILSNHKQHSKGPLSYLRFDQVVVKKLLFNILFLQGRRWTWQLLVIYWHSTEINFGINSNVQRYITTCAPSAGAFATPPSVILAHLRNQRAGTANWWTFSAGTGFNGPTFTFGSVHRLEVPNIKSLHKRVTQQFLSAVNRNNYLDKIGAKD